MKSYFLIFSAFTLTSFISCDRNELDFAIPESEDDRGALVETATFKQVSIVSTLEQPTSGGGTRTSLVEGCSVAWSPDDSFDLIPASGNAIKDVLVATVTSKSAGLGITVNSSSNHYVKYEGIMMTVGGTDVTDVVTKTEANASNTYRVGIYNSNTNYQYAPANTVITANINNSGSVYTLPLVQSSSSASISSSNQAIVTLTGLQYSSDNQNWTVIDENTTLSNGFGGKGQVSYEWQYRPGTEAASTTVANISGDGLSFDASIQEGIDYYAAYPKSSSSLSGSTMTFILPQVQHYVEGTFAPGANPAAGVLSRNGDEYSVTMKNICGILALKIKGSAIVNSLEVTDPDMANSLWGKATLDVSQIGRSGAAVSDGSNTLKLVCDGGVQLQADEAKTFYLVVPVGAFAMGISVKINTPNGSATKSASVANTIARSMIKAMPVFSADNLNYSVVEFDIENDAVAEYMLNAYAPLTEAYGNYQQAFFDQTRAFRPDQPKTMTLSFANPGSATVVMSEHSDYSDPVLTTTVTGSSFELRNMIPDHTYYYKVYAREEILTSGVFKAVGQMRMIATEKGFNVRDLGGWTGLNGNKVRYAQIYRGASVGGTDKNGTQSDITDEDRAELKRIGIKAHLDLRASSNLGRYPDETSLHSYARTTSALSNVDFNNTMTDHGAYNEDASVIADVAWIIYEVMNGKPVYFNCRQGADRTGTIAFILEGLLGCYGTDGTQMGMDYELTGFSQANLVDNLKVTTSYRGAREAATNTSKLFYQLLHLSGSGVTLNNLQERCYYYLNRYASTHSFSRNDVGRNDLTIDKADLDRFINYMLGVTDLDGNLTEGHSARIVGPSWAVSTGTDLKTIGEAKANVVTYK